MKKQITIIMIIIGISILFVGVWFLIKYYKSHNTKSQVRDKRDISDVEMLGALLGINMNNNVTINGLEFEYEKDATCIYICLRMLKDQLSTSEMKFDWNAKKTPLGIETALLGKFEKGTLGFDVNKIDYVKKLYKEYVITSSLTEETSTSCSIFAFVEKEETENDYINVFIFSIVPDTLNIDIGELTNG
ncbi:MAG: hypothetical protein FWH57_09895 [Oscillospiraceae bacterium]|nr:hypothetical protein [Oscillospiraceae bacterium]